MVALSFFATNFLGDEVDCMQVLFKKVGHLSLSLSLSLSDRGEQNILIENKKGNKFGQSALLPPLSP